MVQKSSMDIWKTLRISHIPTDATIIKTLLIRTIFGPLYGAQFPFAFKENKKIAQIFAKQSILN